MSVTHDMRPMPTVAPPTPAPEAARLRRARRLRADSAAIEAVGNDVNSLILDYQRTSDRVALEMLMTEFDWVALACARRMRRRGEPTEDLEQVAREAVLGAISRFDTTHGVPFVSFAWATTIGVLRHHYRSRWQVRVPRGLQELHLATVRAVQELSAAGHAPTVDELASYLAVDRLEVLKALAAGNAYRAASFDDLSTDGGSRTTPRHLGALDNGIETTIDRTWIEQMLTSLPPRYRDILTMRFFEERTQLEIGASLGISQVHVSRLLRCALAALRTQGEHA